MNGIQFFIAVAAFWAAVYHIPRAFAYDRMTEYHLMHGPKSGCVECADK